MRTYTSFVRYGDFGPDYLPGPFTIKQIADNLGIGDPEEVTAAARRIGINGSTYTGRQATHIMKELQGLA
jgi:2-hydroxychromene-2-carboxylate isomerase